MPRGRTLSRRLSLELAAIPARTHQNRTHWPQSGLSYKGKQRRRDSRRGAEVCKKKATHPAGAWPIFRSSPSSAPLRLCARFSLITDWFMRCKICDFSRCQCGRPSPVAQAQMEAAPGGDSHNVPALRRPPLRSGLLRGGTLCGANSTSVAEERIPLLFRPRQRNKKVLHDHPFFGLVYQA